MAHEMVVGGGGDLVLCVMPRKGVENEVLTSVVMPKLPKGR